jgi:plasmid replication initiation protein
MNTDLTDRNYSRQSHLIVNAKYALTPSEINLILTLLTAIKKEDSDFKDYTFTLSEFNKKTKKSMTTKDLNNTVKSLMSKPLEIYISEKKWKIFHWFSYFECDDGLITCRFDKALKPYLLDIKDRFVVSDLRMILPIRSSYSKRMYLLLKEYAKIGMRTFNVEELQEILKVPKSKKEKYSKFKSDVLRKAEADINKFTDLEVSFSEKKRGRKVIEVTYTIRKNFADLKAFIATIRELYINTLLYHTKDGRPLKCSDTGLLYYSDTMENINKVESMKLWEYLHENQARLTCFQGNLFDEEEVMKKLQGK